MIHDNKLSYDIYVLFLSTFISGLLMLGHLVKAGAQLASTGEISLPSLSFGVYWLVFLASFYGSASLIRRDFTSDFKRGY